MHRASNTVGAIAAALAKAQIELVNPEKSLTARIRTGGSQGPHRDFRYASLSSGLDIVRKTLGRHEIAMVQTTEVDAKANMVNLTTVLAHSSGEWMASDWPVCSLSDTMAQHQMGAALTYARRYALFTLVGIAGEDDLDAPDLNAATLVAAAGREANRNGQDNSALDFAGKMSPRIRSAPARDLVPTPNKALAPEQSTLVRDRLLAELKSLLSLNDAVLWARQALALKNSMTTEDAQAVEAAFESRMASLQAENTVQAAPIPSLGPEQVETPLQPAIGEAANAKDSALLLQKVSRHRDRAHLRFVGSRPCLVCGRQPSDAHHLRFAQSRALGRKVSDEFTVPLCRTHHREAHRSTNEPSWWRMMNIDPLPVAQRLWQTTRMGRSIRSAATSDNPALADGTSVRFPDDPAAVN